VISVTLLAVARGAVIWLLPVPVGLKLITWHMFASFVSLIATLILQLLSLGAVSLIGLTESMITGTLSIGYALLGFADSIIWLVVSAFLFTTAFIKNGVGYRIADGLIRAIETAA
jgi:DASS family divalent anion:Na+ symporter